MTIYIPVGIVTVFLQLNTNHVDFIFYEFILCYRTALAEAELEYHDNHESTAVYVKFPLLNMPEILRRDFSE